MLFSQLSLALEAGECLQVLGPNGSGKTSLLRILSGLRRPDEGHVRWNGRPIDLGDDSFAEALSYLGVQSGLKPDLTPLENLRYAASLVRACRLDPIQALQSVRLDAYAEVACRQLSTGQLRRVALARLVMLGTCLWLLDEPLTGLDQASRSEFEQALQTHIGTGGMVILTTHQPLRNGSRIKQLELGP